MTVPKPCAAKSHRAACARRGRRRHRFANTALSPPAVLYPPMHCGVRRSRALSLDAPNAQWPAASLVLAPILNLQGRSR